jgi:HNH endonuclease
MIRGFSAVLIATDGVGPPPQKKDPRRRARAKSQGSPTTRALSFGNPAPAPAQVRREARILHEQGIAEVPLTRGKVAIIDIDDAERVSAYQWRGIVSDGIWYAATQPPRSGGTRATILLHRFLLDSPAHAEVDHIDGDGLNCRRSNLRLATRVQNSGIQSALQTILQVSREYPGARVGASGVSELVLMAHTSIWVAFARRKKPPRLTTRPPFGFSGNSRG